MQDSLQHLLLLLPLPLICLCRLLQTVNQWFKLQWLFNERSTVGCCIFRSHIYSCKLSWYLWLDWSLFILLRYQNHQKNTMCYLAQDFLCLMAKRLWFWVPCNILFSGWLVRLFILTDSCIFQSSSCNIILQLHQGH